MNIRYVNSLNYTVDLMTEKVRIREANFHNISWKPVGTPLQNGIRLKEFNKDPVKYDVTIGFHGSLKERIEATRNFFEITDLDIINETAGRLYWGEYYIECYVTNLIIEPSEIGSMTLVKCSFYCPRQIWIKETTQAFNISIPTTFGLNSGKNLDYDYDYEYDYTTRLNRMAIINTNYVPDDVRITIYGLVKDPAITIGGNLYKMNCQVEDGTYLVIDGMKKEIYHVGRKGKRTNYFKYREKERYIFEQVAVGYNNVTWNSDFRFDITLIEKRGEPEWT